MLSETEDVTFWSFTWKNTNCISENDIKTTSVK